MATQALADDGSVARQFLTFRLDGRLYALPADEVAEVIRLPTVARVPQAPQGLLGLANLRGSVIPVASGRGLLTRPEGEATNRMRAIVLQSDAPVAVAVDAVEELIHVGAEKVETRAAEMAALPGEELRGVFPGASGKGAIKILDLQPLLAIAFTARPRKQAAPRQATAEALVQDSAASQVKLITFEVAGQEYGLPLASVQEVVALPTLATAVPNAEDVVFGVVSLRDTLLPLLSLRSLLGLPPSDPTGTEKIVVARLGDSQVGLVADRMTAIVAASDENMEDIPDILATRLGGESRIRSIYRGEGGRRLISVLSTDLLFGDDVMHKLETARRATQPPQTQQVAGKTMQFVVFRLGAEEFGLPIDAVDEVVRMPDQIARLPKAPKFLEGVVNLRGAVVPVIDQRRRFGMPAGEETARRRLIVVRTGAHRAGLIVDSVSEVLRTSEDEIAPAPALTGETNPLVQGVVNLQPSDRMILLLDASELLTRAERSLLDKFDRHKNAEQPKR